MLDFGSKASREITVETEQSQGIAGVHVAVGDTVTYPQIEPGIALFLGDSFSAGTGSTVTNDAHFNALVEQLGFDSIWASGSAVQVISQPISVPTTYFRRALPLKTIGRSR